MQSTMMPQDRKALVKAVIFSLVTFLIVLFLQIKVKDSPVGQGLVEGLFSAILVGVLSYWSLRNKEQADKMLGDVGSNFCRILSYIFLVLGIILFVAGGILALALWKVGFIILCWASASLFFLFYFSFRWLAKKYEQKFLKK